MNPLSVSEMACYVQVVALIYSNAGPIDDTEALAKAMGCDRRTWLAARRRLLDLGKLVLVEVGGAPKLHNPRARRELTMLALDHSRKFLGLLDR